MIVLRQSLSALSYLHQPQRELVHGQINPRNILVQYRDAGDISGHLHIKLSDFGSSRDLRPSRRRETYLPPDDEDGSPRDSSAIAGDIWSLGLVVFEMAYELPTRRRESHSQWCDKVVAKVNSERPSALIKILQNMLTIDPNARNSASVCLDEALRELNRFQPRSVTPAQASHAQPTHDFVPPLDDFGPLGNDYMPPQNLFSPPRDLFDLPQDYFDLPQDHFDLPENAFSPAVGHAGPANGAGYEGDGPVQACFQPDQPALPSPGNLFLPEEAGVPAPSPSPFISVELFNRHGEVGEEKMLRRQNNEMAAIYNPLRRIINITSVLKGLRVGHKSQSRVIQAVITDADTKVLRKTRVPGATGTWITFDRALRLADSVDYVPHLKEVILAASQAI